MANTNVGIRIVVLGAAEAHRQVGALRNDLTRFAATMDAASAGSAAFGRSLVRAGDAMVSFGRTLTFGVTAPILALTGTLVKAGIDFEQAFVGVAKTVDGVAKGFNEIATEMYGTTTGLNDLQKQAVFTNEEFGKLTDFGEKLSDQFIDLSLNIPIAATELARIGQVSGQLGVSASQIENFTETIAKLSVTTDLSSEAAAFAIARVANIMGIESEKMAEFAQRFGASIVALGNSAAATEPEIVNLTLRLAAAGRVAGLTTPDILGLSTSLAEMGVRAERGGTAVSRVIYEMIFAISDGGDALDTFAQIAGLSAQEFATRFKTDALGTLELFLTRLADAQDAGRITKDTLLELGLSGIRVREVLNLLGPNIELVRENVALANMQWQEQIALQEEFVKQSKTIRNQIQLLKNSFMALGVEVLKDLRDDIERLITGMRNLIQRFIDMDPALRQTILRFGLLIATFGPALLAIGTLTQLAGNAVISLTKLSGAFRGLLALPFTPLLGIFGLFFGGGKGKDKKGGLLSGLTKLIPKPQSFAKDVKGIVGIFKSILVGAISPVTKLVSSFVTGVFSQGFNVLTSVPGSIVGVLRGFGTNFLFLLFNSFIPGLGFGISQVFDTITSPIQKLVNTIFGSLGGAIKSTFGIFGTLVTSTAKRIPVFGVSLVNFILKPLKAIPTLIAVAAAGFTLLFAPKVITQAVKNWDKLLAEFKLSFTNFTEDLKREGIERALLLFVSGGSLGSGRQGGILGIAKALGASEENARKFSYALGTATSHAIQIYKATVAFVKFLINGVTNSLKLEKSVGSTSDRIIALTTAIAQFLGGFFIGWTESFGDMAAAFDTFIRAVKDAFSSFGALFTAIFGSAQKTQNEFISQLEPDFESTASNIGKTAGEILGQIVSFSLQGFALIANIVTVVVDAFTSLVNAYKEGGLKGVFEELGPTLKTIWDGIILAAGTLWDTVKPSLESFVNSAVSWLQTDGVSLLAAGVSSIGSVVKDAFENALFGREQRQFFMTTPSGITREIPDYGDAQRRKGLKQAGFDLSSDLVREGGLVESLGELTTQMITYITNSDVRDRVTEGFNVLVGWVGDILGGAWSIIEPKITPLLNDFDSWINTTAKPKAEEWATTLGDAFKNKLKDIITPDFLAAAVEDLEKGNLAGAVTNLSLFLSKPLEDAAKKNPANISPTDVLPANIMSDIQEYANISGKSVGEAISDGVTAGIITKEQATLLRMAFMLQTLVANAKSYLGIFSPSSVFSNIGRDIMLGLIYGMQSYQTYLQSVLNSIMYQFDIFAMGITNSTTSVTAQLMNFYNTASTLLTLISGAVSSAFSFLTGTAPAAGSSESNVNYNTYSPQFVGPQPSSTYMQNQQMYSQYLLAQQAVG
jgi:TP901 family phage tail tape measure protein